MVTTTMALAMDGHLQHSFNHHLDASTMGTGTMAHGGDNDYPPCPSFHGGVSGLKPLLTPTLLMTMSHPR